MAAVFLRAVFGSDRGSSSTATQGRVSEPWAAGDGDDLTALCRRARCRVPQSDTEPYTWFPKSAPHVVCRPLDANASDYARPAPPAAVALGLFCVSKRRVLEASGLIVGAETEMMVARSFFHRASGAIAVAQQHPVLAPASTSSSDGSVAFRRPWPLVLVATRG